MEGTRGFFLKESEIGGKAIRYRLLCGTMFVPDFPGDYYEEVGEFKRKAQDGNTQRKFDWPFKKFLNANNCPIRRCLSRRAFDCGIIVFNPKVIQRKPDRSEENGTSATGNKSSEAKSPWHTSPLSYCKHMTLVRRC